MKLRTVAPKIASQITLRSCCEEEKHSFKSYQSREHQTSQGFAPSRLQSSRPARTHALALGGGGMGGLSWKETQRWCLRRETSRLQHRCSLLAVRVPFYKELKQAAAAAESLQSCPTLYDPINGSPLGSSVPGILQARILENFLLQLKQAVGHRQAVLLVTVTQV